MDFGTFILAVLGTNVVTVIVTQLFNRRKEAADVRRLVAQTNQLEIANEQSSIEFYRQQVGETIAEMKKLKAEVSSLKVAIEEAQTKYERRVGSLHEQLEGLASELERANRALDKANETIDHLRQEVKDGNVIITELREKVSELLVEREQKK